MHYLSLWDWLNSFSAMLSGFIHVAACCKVSFMAEEIIEFHINGTLSGTQMKRFSLCAQWFTAFSIKETYQR